MSEDVLIYEKSRPGRTGFSLAATAAGDEAVDRLIPASFRRHDPPALPEISEPEAVRHYVNLSAKNHHIDKGFYPLGSCTMKYNPKVNELVAALPGFARLHPLQPDEDCQGALELMYHLAAMLADITGFARVSLQPVAGAHGELTGLLVMRAAMIKRGNVRKKIIIPDSAHGTNPASVILAGYEVVQVKSTDAGTLTAADVAAVMDEDTAGIMITNPNTLGLFESEIARIAEVVHSRGGLLYMDGANLNALLGQAKPAEMGYDVLHFNLHKTFSTPHGGGGPGAGGIAVTRELAPFLPSPLVEREGGRYFLHYDRPDSIGRVHNFHGNFANMVRGYAYIRQMGAPGLKDASTNAVLNANYLMKLLKDRHELPHDTTCQHEFVLSASRQKKRGAKAADVAKRLLDYGYHAPTIYFPLIVHEAIMIEPTETESKETLDRFAEAMIAIDREIDENLEAVTSAPRTTPVRRLDEVRATKTLDIKFVG